MTREEALIIATEIQSGYLERHIGRKYPWFDDWYGSVKGLLRGNDYLLKELTTYIMIRETPLMKALDEIDELS